MTFCDVYRDFQTGRRVVCIGDSHGMVTVSDLESREKSTVPERSFDGWEKIGRMCPDCEEIVSSLLEHWKTCHQSRGR